MLDLTIRPIDNAEVKALKAEVERLKIAINRALSFVEHSEYLPGSRIAMAVNELKDALKGA